MLIRIVLRMLLLILKVMESEFRCAGVVKVMYHMLKLSALKAASAGSGALLAVGAVMYCSLWKVCDVKLEAGGCAVFARNAGE